MIREQAGFLAWRSRIPLIPWILSFCLMGCAVSMGARFDASQVGKIQIGKTSQSEIREILGPPASFGTKNGRPMWVYWYAQIRLLGSSTKGTVLSVEFDDQGIVDGFSYVPY